MYKNKGMESRFFSSELTQIRNKLTFENCRSCLVEASCRFSSMIASRRFAGAADRE